MRDLEQVAHAVELERRLDNLSQPEQAYHYQPITVVKGWNPSTNKAEGTINLQAAGWGTLPAGIKAVAVRLYYVAATAGDWGALEASNGDGHMVVSRCPANGVGIDTAGIVNCASNGDIWFDTNNTTNTVYLYVGGYFI